jgi:hypothetical protein
VHSLLGHKTCEAVDGRLGETTLLQGLLLQKVVVHP